MIKLIATDIDGTLVKDGTLGLNKEYYEVIEKLTNQGVIFVACSGRQFVSEAKLFAPIKDKLMYISDGGTVVRTPEQILKKYTLPEEIWKGMYDTMEVLPECECCICLPSVSYAENERSRMFSWLRDSYGFEMKAFAPLNQIPNPEDVIKFSVYHPTSCEKLCKEEFIPTWNDRAKLSAAGVEWLDCIEKNACKGTAINWLQNYLGISPDETMTFGDNINDIEMLQAAGQSFAVSNARKEVLEAAKSTVKPYWEDGVLEKLKTLL